MSRLLRLSSADPAAILSLGEYDCRDLNRATARRHPDGTYSVEVLEEDGELEALREEGFAVDVLHERTEDITDRARELVGDPQRLLEDGFEGSADFYTSTDQVEPYLKQLHDWQPAVTSLIPLPERTHEGRQCSALRIGKDQSGNRPALMIVGGIHAREWGTVDSCLWFAYRLLENWKKRRPFYGGKWWCVVEWIDAVLDWVDLIVFPQVNPDGRLHSMTSQGKWRKNRRTELPGGEIGVDINRNFDFLWDETLGQTSAEAKCSTYKGDTAASEPETRNVAWLLRSHPNIRYYIDVHSFASKCMHSWGDDSNQSDNQSMTFQSKWPDRGKDIWRNKYGEYVPDLHRKALEARSKWIASVASQSWDRTYQSTQSAELYAVSGDSESYAFSLPFVHQTIWGLRYAFTFEQGTSWYHWDTQKELYTTIDETMAALMHAAMIAVNDQYHARSEGAPGERPPELPPAGEP